MNHQLPQEVRPYKRSPQEEHLVELLTSVLAGPTPSADVAQSLAAEVVANIGSPDPELRDDLGVAALVSWILDDALVPPRQLREFLSTCLGEDGVRFRLGEEGTDSVFRRSFSLLVVVLIVAADNKEAFLTDVEFDAIVEGLCSYCTAEMDFRAEVARRGWAHSIAHAADLADECAQSRFATPKTASQLVRALSSMVDRCDGVFQGEEDERLANAFVALEKLDSGPTFSAWMDNGNEREGATRINWKNIARSIYFRFDPQDHAEQGKLLAGIQKSHTR